MHIAFFNNKGGVGKTSLVYHVAWMLSDLGVRVLCADLDPQANLTAAFLDEDRLIDLWEEDREPGTVYDLVQPLLKGVGDIDRPQTERVEDNISLLVGDLALSNFEDELSEQWAPCLDGRERSFRVISSFWRILESARKEQPTDVTLIDLGPNLGALNRAALISADHVVIPLSPDLFSLQGLRNLGPTFRRWRGEWKERLEKNPAPEQLELPAGRMQPAGYILLQHAVRLDRPVKAYERWISRIPEVYHTEVLDEKNDGELTVREDPHCLALLKHYRSLMPLAQDARKPIFHLKPADGAIGAHLKAVKDAERDFWELTFALARKVGIPGVPEAPPKPSETRRRESSATGTQPDVR